MPAVLDAILEALDNVGVLGSIVLLVARVDGDLAILVEMNLRALSVILPLARKLHVLEPRENLLNALRGMRQHRLEWDPRGELACLVQLGGPLREEGRDHQVVVGTLTLM